jgi:hypothetical protein
MPSDAIFHLKLLCFLVGKLPTGKFAARGPFVSSGASDSGDHGEGLFSDNRTTAAGPADSPNAICPLINSGYIRMVQGWRVTKPNTAWILVDC